MFQNKRGLSTKYSGGQPPFVCHHPPPFPTLKPPPCFKEGVGGGPCFKEGVGGGPLF